MSGAENTSERVVPFAAVDSLTPRERECLLLVAEHLRSKEIARKLGLSPLTVDKYIASACERLDVNSRHEAAQLVARASGAVPASEPSVDEPVIPPSMGRLLSRTRQFGEQLDVWEVRHRSWVRAAGQIASLYAIFSIVRVLSRRGLILLSTLLPADLQSLDFVARGPSPHPLSMAEILVGTYWDVVTIFTLITVTLALWRGRLAIVAAAASFMIGTLICEGFELLLKGPAVIRLVTLTDVTHLVLLAAFWTLYPRRWLSLVVVFEALMVAADFNVPSNSSMNGQLWIISQAYLTVFGSLTIAMASGVWPWAGRRLGGLRAWLAGDLIPTRA